MAWKVKDAKSLEDDLIGSAYKLELSMIQTCKITNEGESDNIGGDLKAIWKKVWFVQTWKNVYLVPILSWSFFLQSTLGFINSSIKI